MPAPERLGPYRIGKPLGKGGMGTVHEAANTETGERVAVKTLAPELATSEGFRDRFEAEIESLRILRHPNIVRLYGYGEEDGLLFYSMELVEGISLEDELRAGRRFDWREVTQIAIQVSRALKHAHDHGIIHRDIKPANILLHDEQVKLADFGIAQLFGGAKLTTARGVLGTADFMSPEQAESRPVTDRCDQYSLGCVMYALLAGRPPFRAKGLPEMLQLQRYAEPEPVCRFATDTPKQLEKVVMQLLEKSPKDRFPNTLVLAKHLEAMSLAFSRPQIEESDFQFQPHAPSPAAAIGDLAETPAEVSKADEIARLEYETLAPPTRGPSDLSVVEEPSNKEQSEALAGPTTERRFTIVSDDSSQTPSENRPWWLMLTQGVVLLLLIMGVAYGLIRGMQPATADSLYNQITSAAEQGDQAVFSAEEPITEFLERFPDDPRAAEVAPLAQQIALSKAERRMMAMLKRRDESDSPLDSLYLEAMRNAKDYPEQALGKLQAMSRLMAGEADPGKGDATRVMQQLVGGQIERLKNRVEQRASTQLPFLEERLASAKQLATTDPADTRSICHSIVELYEGRDWAGELVEQARALLLELDEDR